MIHTRIEQVFNRMVQEALNDTYPGEKVSNEKYTYGDRVLLPNGGGEGEVISWATNKNGNWYTVESTKNDSHLYPVYEENLRPVPKFKVGDHVYQDEVAQVPDGTIVRDGIGDWFYRDGNYWYTFGQSFEYPNESLAFPLEIKGIEQ